MLYLNATGFEARAVRTPRNAPSLVIGAGRVRARPPWAVKTWVGGPEGPQRGPAHSAGRQDTGTVSLGCGAAISRLPKAA